MNGGLENGFGAPQPSSQGKENVPYTKEKSEAVDTILEALGKNENLQKRYFWITANVVPLEYKDTVITELAQKLPGYNGDKNKITELFTEIANRYKEEDVFIDSDVHGMSQEEYKRKYGGSHGGSGGSHGGSSHGGGHGGH